VNPARHGAPRVRPCWARLRAASVVGLASAWVAACGVGVTRPPASVAPWPSGPGIVDVYAVGDIADCAGVEPHDSAAARTAELVPPGSVVLGLGDMAYPLATESLLASCFEPTWGVHRDRTYAVPGNHDYVHGDAAAFRGYFRVPATDPGFVAYTAQVAPGWLFIALDSSADSAALQRELDWLRHALETVALEDSSFTRAKAVFTESDEQCVFTVELDAGKKAPTPLVLDLELLEDAVTDSGRQALLTEEVRQYVRRTLGQ